MPIADGQSETTFDDVWYYDHSLLKFADDKDRADILAGFRNAVKADGLRGRAADLRRYASDHDREARALVDFRDEVLTRLKARATGAAP